MYCPTCGSEERQLSQYCRACGTDLRAVRLTLEKPDTITASAVSAREQISLALAEKIRELESSDDLQRVAEDVLPGVEKFLESPEEKRLRRIRAGVICASIGLGATLATILLSFADRGFFPFIGVGLVAFFIGLGILINGLDFTLPRKELIDKTDAARAQNSLDREKSVFSGPATVSASDNSGESQDRLLAASVTEHTTHQLKQDRSRVK